MGTLGKNNMKKEIRMVVTLIKKKSDLLLNIKNIRFVATLVSK